MQAQITAWAQSWITTLTQRSTTPTLLLSHIARILMAPLIITFNSLIIITIVIIQEPAGGPDQHLCSPPCCWPCSRCSSGDTHTQTHTHWSKSHGDPSVSPPIQWCDSMSSRGQRVGPPQGSLIHEAGSFPPIYALLHADDLHSSLQGRWSE